MFTHYFKVGAGVLIAVVILVIGYRQVQEFKLTKDNSYPLYVEFDTVQGLAEGNAVWLSGYKIGKVERIELMPDGRVELVLKIDNRYKIIRGSVFSIKVGFLEDKILSIERSAFSKTPYRFYKPGDRIKRTVSPTTIPDLVEQANIALGQMTGILTRVHELVDNGQIQQNIIDITENVRMTTQEVYAFARMLKETGLSNQQNVNDIVKNVDILTENLISTSQKLDQILVNVDDMVGDEDMKQGIKDTVTDLRQAVANVQETTQAIRDMAVDPAVQSDIRDTLKTTKSTMQNADVAVGAFSKMIHTINDTEIKPDFEFRYEGREDVYKADMNMRIFPPNSNVYYLFGFDDLGESASTNLQFGVRGGVPDLWYRLGIKSGKLGLGFEYQKKTTFYEGELLDPNDLQLNIRTGRGVTPNTFVVLGWEGAFKRDSISVGVLQRY
jgi:phospholipid/cholesterol/gamma-HCH transport system substrate-binding protein